ncbi:MULTISPECIES: zinc dependent phospholipase C family protein [Methylotenera]|uniref:zinc dependent phospholipase C family protein n=1 Tax=Methylotenera TaxID=359407 RepID=UPI00037FEA0B|nr:MULTISPECIES: zinc dependent phospholipase C family protein [Methylotenera]
MKKRLLRHFSRHFPRNFLWCLPLSLFSIDANAWGLYTHIYFAQWLLMASPLLDPKIQQAIKKFPTLVLAGACLPDLAIISKHFHTTHQWQKAEWMIENAHSEQEIAIAVGYTSHLFVDVVAHNHFVPAFEAKWKRIPWLNNTLITHIASEWAMDAHIAKHIEYTPNQLIRLHIDELSAFVAPCFFNDDIDFKYSPAYFSAQASVHLKRLAWADYVLRKSRLSSAVLALINFKDKRFVKNLEYYLVKTKNALTHFDQSVQGNRPMWEPELKHLNAAEMIVWREKCLTDLTKRLATPIHFYNVVAD